MEQFEKAEQIKTPDEMYKFWLLQVSLSSFDVKAAWAGTSPNGLVRKVITC